jgi:hypothetical protein
LRQKAIAENDKALFARSTKELDAALAEEKDWDDAKRARDDNARRVALLK